MDDLTAAMAAARILVVDDNAANVALLEAMLEEEGYTDVTGLTDPREVVPLYERRRFDLVLLDIRMPHLDGHQVMERLAAIKGDDYLPILVLTAQSDTETRLRALASGAKDFLTKPFDHLEVSSRIRNMLEVRILFNERRREAEILEQRVKERTRELHDTQLEIIRRLARAGEYRDNDTGSHVARMSLFSRRLAEAAEIGEIGLDLILPASQMHDIGKIGIPDNILLKPGRLDPDERRIIETHCEIGAKILAGHHSPLLAMASTIALTHHEKWDGSGYPRGLVGEDIPIAGRITAICDVFDALTMERPYKAAWRVEDALIHIREQSGRHFDPRLVELFIEILPDIHAIRAEFREG